MTHRTKLEDLLVFRNTKIFSLNPRVLIGEGELHIFKAGEVLCLVLPRFFQLRAHKNVNCKKTSPNRFRFDLVDRAVEVVLTQESNIDDVDAFNELMKEFTIFDGSEEPNDSIEETEKPRRVIRTTVYEARKRAANMIGKGKLAIQNITARRERFALDKACLQDYVANIYKRKNINTFFAMPEDVIQLGAVMKQVALEELQIDFRVELVSIVISHLTIRPIDVGCVFNGSCAVGMRWTYPQCLLIEAIEYDAVEDVFYVSGANIWPDRGEVATRVSGKLSREGTLTLSENSFHEDAALKSGVSLGSEYTYNLNLQAMVRRSTTKCELNGHYVYHGYRVSSNLSAEDAKDYDDTREVTDIFKTRNCNPVPRW